MKTTLAIVTILACTLMQGAFAAETGKLGIAAVMLNKIADPIPADSRLAFKATDGQQCSYFGKVEANGSVTINRKKCNDMMTPVDMRVDLHAAYTGTDGIKFYRVIEQGPAPLAVSFMTQFYDVPAEAVTVTVTDQTKNDAKVEAKAAGHVCEFDAARLPEGSSTAHGWAAASMRCGATGG